MPENSARWRAVRACDELSFWHEWATESVKNFDKDLKKKPDQEVLQEVVRALGEVDRAMNNLKRALMRLRGRGLIKRD